jgi:hypothetical protein
VAPERAGPNLIETSDQIESRSRGDFKPMLSFALMR